MTKWIAIVVVSLVATGCKQALGERCQVNADCTSHLCSASEPKVCVATAEMKMGDIDATVPDAP